MANGPELLLKPTHGLIEERRGFLRESAALPVQLRAQPAKRASSARKLLPVPMNGVHKSKQPLLRRTQAVPLRPGCAKLLEAPLHHGFGEFFLGFEVVVDIAHRHASCLGDVRQTRLSETASIRQLRRSLNQPRSLVRLCRSHILQLGGVSYLTNSEHKPDAPVLSTLFSDDQGKYYAKGAFLIRARSVVQVHPGPPFKPPISPRRFSLSPSRGVVIKKPFCQKFAKSRVGHRSRNPGRSVARPA